MINSIKNKIEKFYKNIWYRLIKSPGSYTKGSPIWFSAIEKKYGGYVTGVERKKVSENDPRPPSEIKWGGMTGGDRMFFHSYGNVYAGYLKDFLQSEKFDLTILEVGILKGTGLALWSEVFPNATIFGFDIDLSHTKKNMGNLKTLGAFSKSDPKLFTFDQFKPNTDEVVGALDGRKIDIAIDDGFHSDDTILNTFDALRESFADKFVYFIEDSDTAYEIMKLHCPEFHVFSHGQLTVVKSKA
jgi:hypothetical protein